MAGILDDKTRIMDLLITREGRRQAAAGQLRVRFATFTDYNTYYQVSGSYGIAEDASGRILFEASSRYQDLIVPELEPGTNSISRNFRTSDLVLEGTNLVDGTFTTGLPVNGSAPLSGSNLDSSRSRFLGGITQNFKDLRILSTEDTFSNTLGFKLSSPKTGSFHIPVQRGEDFYNEAGSSGLIDLDSSPSMFRDLKTSHLPNFKYLPPINITNDETVEGQPMGDYPDLNTGQILDIKELEDHLSGKQYFEIDFVETSLENNLICQMFEFTENSAQKLSIIDFGSFPDSDFASPDKHVYFIGKVRRDSAGVDTFINMFTVVFD